MSEERGQDGGGGSGEKMGKKEVVGCVREKERAVWDTKGGGGRTEEGGRGEMFGLWRRGSKAVRTKTKGGRKGRRNQSDVAGIRTKCKRALLNANPLCTLTSNKKGRGNVFDRNGAGRRESVSE